jgi:hypothetical protein
MFTETCNSERRLVAVVVLAQLLAVLPATPVARAQTTSGTLVGTVYLPTGAPAANARVTASNELNGNSRSTVTGNDGSYRIPFLPPGRYTIKAVLTGFTESSITGFPIPLNSTTNLVPPITLSGGPAATTTTTTTTTTTGATTAAAPTGESRGLLVNTNDATRRGNFTEQQVETLPLGGTTETRTFDELALLVAGVAPAPYVPGVRGPGVGFGIGTAGQFAVNGLRSRSNNFTVDGSDNNDPDVGVRRQGFVTLVPQSIESIQEFQLSTLLWDAELGRNYASQVNAVSKSGGSEPHGQAYIFFTDEDLAARNFFDYTDGGAMGAENPYTRTMAGFVFGGPIVKDSTQGFFSFERQQIRASIEQHFATLQQAERGFFGFPLLGIVNPLPGVIDVGASRFGATPLGLSIFSFYPLPNNPGGPYGDNTYSEELPADGDGIIFSAKVNHAFNERHSFSARYNYTDDERVLPAVNRAIRSSINAETRTNNLSLIFDSQLANNLFNQARFSWGRTDLEFPEYPTSPFLFRSQALQPFILFDGAGIPFELSLPTDTGPIGQLIIDPYSPVGVDVYTFPQDRKNNTFQYADTLSWTYGTHSMKFGADIRHVNLNSNQARNYRPQVVFGSGAFLPAFVDQGGNLIPLDTLNLLLGRDVAALGMPSSYFQSFTNGPADPHIELQFTEVNLFFNDNWRMFHNFTLDFGMRYEYNTVPEEADHKIESALALEGLPPISSGMDRRDAAEYTAAVAAYAEYLDGRERIYDNDPNNFGPHVGFAWDPWSNGKTAVRGGYGVYFDTILGAVVSQSRNIFPREVPFNIDPQFVAYNSFFLNYPQSLVLINSGCPIVESGTLNQLGCGASNFPVVVGGLLDPAKGASGISFTLPQKDLATPYAQHWQLSIEQSFLDDYFVSAAYVGTKANKMTRLVTPNNGSLVLPFGIVDPVSVSFPVVLDPTAFNLGREFVQPRPNANLGGYQQFENTANSNYHALQLEARKRYSHGYEFTVAYTWSHAIDDVSDVFPIAGAPALPQSYNNLRAERGDANYDVRHRFAASMVWDLPFFRDEVETDPGDAAFWLGGWQVSTIFQGHTGQPFTLGVPFDVNLDRNLTDRPTTTDGLTFVDDHGPVRVQMAPGLSFLDFINNTVSFLTIFAGESAVGRNTVRADGFVNWDIAFNKRFYISEVQNIELRTEVFNVFNRANFGIPIRIIDAPGFGSSVETANAARFIQFALKYSF